ncbi:hypothetical protein BDR26DRAFT_848690 [Obelidium mucronatum]|nr:hypothetical protein BDR26DRAFT_848690 [Obelidium mucronatum]
MPKFTTFTALSITAALSSLASAQLVLQPLVGNSVGGPCGGGGNTDSSTCQPNLDCVNNKCQLKVSSVGGPCMQPQQYHSAVCASGLTCVPGKFVAGVGVVGSNCQANGSTSTGLTGGGSGASGVSSVVSVATLSGTMMTTTAAALKTSSSATTISSTIGDILTTLACIFF